MQGLEAPGENQIDSRSFKDDAVVLAIQYGERIRDRAQDFGCHIGSTALSECGNGTSVDATKIA